MLRKESVPAVPCKESFTKSRVETAMQEFQAHTVYAAVKLFPLDQVPSCISMT
jgi:hypothetical protein